jgi:uncharacterized protein (DUF305 family)
MNLLRAFLMSFAALTLSFPAFAQEDHSNHHMGMTTTQTDHYAPAMKTMHENMMVTPTGDADVDFVRGMIPHHQGAIDMAKILLEKGKDPELKKLAADIIKAQETEIAFMKDWLAKHDH